MIESLLAEMTVDEKIGQMTQSVWHNNVSPEIIRDRVIGSIIHTDGPVPGPEVADWTATFDRFQEQALKTRLGIPLLIGVDAVHGQNTYEGAVIFPHNIGMGATRNFDLIRQAAEITALETAATGFNWTFSPCIAMPEHEHWGRVFEGFSEDRDLTIAAVKASVQGHQGASLTLPHTVAATAKHFIADGGTEGGREGGNAILTNKEIEERHLPTYQAAVDEGIAAIMVGFNSVNGINMHMHTELVQGVLKDQMGFNGVVMTDWLGGTRFGPAHTVINAGVDVAMQPGNHDEFMAQVKGSVDDGTIPKARIDDAVHRILALKFKLGLFNEPFAKKELAQSVGSDEHRAVARQAVRESLVLLKSENDVLPLLIHEAIAVIGPHANNSGLQSGGWSNHWQGQTTNYRGATTILDGIRGVSSNVEYSQVGCHETMAAKKVVVVVGELPYAEFKGDSKNLDIPDYQKAMIDSCEALNKQIVLVLVSGRPMTITDSIDKSDAFIAAWLPGSEGAGVADFLFATDDFKPVGTLPFSWPSAFEDLPLAADSDKALYPFGAGLSDY
ncbi:MAG: glycoside hydrolase family 3 N-terminal domain-containing protein [Halioglobus sp.]